jgi:hypothetical protein
MSIDSAPATPVDVVHTWDLAEERGWALFPVHAVIDGECTCGLRADAEHTSAGKHPRTRDGFKSATTSRGQWESWYQGYNGRLSWGLATGFPSGNIVVLDVDGRHNGYVSFAAVRDEVGGLPDTLEVRSGSGSPHYYFALPPGVDATSHNNFRPGLDIKANGGYVIVPPASHASGGFYQWANDYKIADAPHALVDLIQRNEHEKAAEQGAIFGVPDSVLLEGLNEGQRDELIYKTCCRWFRKHDGDRGPVEILAMAMAAACNPPFLDWKAKVDSSEKTWRRGVAEEKAAKADAAGRKVVLTKASSILIQPVKWLWQDRMALGVITLLGGREGIGKSTIAYDMVARLTQGALPGCYAGQKKSVIVCATEDSWSHTINPRLMAAGADLDRVFRVNVRVSKEVDVEISLPDDLDALGDLAIETGSAMLLLDPLLSRLDGKLDTHKDAEVRRALEPLAKMADRANISVLGLIHVNKSSSSDPLSLLMASRAFAAMARAVLFAMTDTDDETLRHFNIVKNNLGRMDIPTLDYRIVSHKVADTAEGPIITGKVDWTGESETSIRELLRATGENDSQREKSKPIDSAKEWLREYLLDARVPVPSAQAKEDAKSEGHSGATLTRAMEKLRVSVTYEGSPRKSYWSLFTGEFTS